MLRLPLFTLAAAAVALAGCAPSEAPTAPEAPAITPIIGGTYDPVARPNVGALLYDFDEDGVPTANDLLCSGTYVGLAGNGKPAFLTAAHCLAWLPPSAVFRVTFAPDLTVAALPTVASAGWEYDPGYLRGSGEGHDLGLVYLATAPGVPAAAIAPRGALDAMAAGGGLRGVLFENVGYGADLARRTGPPSVIWPDRRLVSVSPFMGLTRTRLGLLMNSTATGQGGDCYGDSGSPKFLPGQNTVYAIVSWGDVPCRATSWNQRVESAAAHAFLSSKLP